MLDERSSIGPVPIAAFGILAYFILVVLGLLCTGSIRPVFQSAPKIFAGLGTVISVGLILYMRSIMGGTCSLCLLSSVLMALTLLVWTVRSRYQIEVRKSALTCIAILMAVAFAYRGIYQPKRLYLTHDEQALASLPMSDMVATDALQVGSSAADAYVVAFTDLECPACHQFLPALVADAEKSRSAKLVVRHLPLSIHKDAYMLAVACEIARRHGVGAKFLVATAKEGVDPERVCRQLGFPLEEALQSMKEVTSPTKSVLRDLGLARRLHLQGTPMFFYVRKGQPMRLIEPEEAARIFRSRSSWL